MACGGRNFCPRCKEELIHRDHRQAFESASALGQIFWRCGPRNITAGDIDFYTAVFNVARGRKSLFRIIEHKQPSQKLKDMQFKALSTLSLAIEAFVETTGSLFDERSGVYVLRGTIEAQKVYPYATLFNGPQHLSKFVKGELKSCCYLADEESVFRWAEGSLESGQAGPRRNERLPPPITAPELF